MSGICIFIYLRPTYTDYSLDYSRLMALDKLNNLLALPKLRLRAPLD